MKDNSQDKIQKYISSLKEIKIDTSTLINYIFHFIITITALCLVFWCKSTYLGLNIVFAILFPYFYIIYAVIKSKGFSTCSIK